MVKTETVRIDKLSGIGGVINPTDGTDELRKRVWFLLAREIDEAPFVDGLLLLGKSFASS